MGCALKHVLYTLHFLEKGIPFSKNRDFPISPCVTSQNWNSLSKTSVKVGIG